MRHSRVLSRTTRLLIAFGGLALLVITVLEISLDSMHWHSRFARVLAGKPMAYVAIILFVIMLSYLGFDEETTDASDDLGQKSALVKVTLLAIMLLVVLVFAPLVLSLSFFTDHPAALALLLCSAPAIFVYWNKRHRPRR